MAKTPQQPGRAELEILQYVADHHPIRVGEVAEHFARTTGRARTTVLTLMERLRAKRYLSRKRIDGTWHYSPKLAKGTLLRDLVRRFIDESLAGSLAPFLAYLAETDNLTDDEFNELKQLVHDLETQRKGEKS
jgi:predicted transcriptional regulator